MKSTYLIASALVLAAAPAQARNIVITNDDGLTSNTKALYERLVADGHDVIVSVPCQGQSGMGAAVKFLEPLGPLQSDCHNGAAKAGDPGAGQMTRAGLTPDFFYVRGTPVMALLYALDVQAQRRWGKAPDLVLSGPNEGQNVGSVVITSGTVSNAQYGTIRGIPSIALSAGTATADAGLAHPDSARIAALSSQLVSFLERKAGNGRLLPEGVALNVNFPDRLADAPQWRMSRIGTYDAFSLRFSQNLNNEAMVRAMGRPMPELPGVTIVMNTAEPAADQRGDEAAVYKEAIAVSVMQVGYDHGPQTVKRMTRHLDGLVARKR